MVTMSDTPTSNNIAMNDSNTCSSDYEKCREERIKENLERMQKLGIYDLSLKFKSVKRNDRRKNYNNKTTPTNNASISSTPFPSSAPARRSSRLQNTPAVSYTEAVVPKKGKEGYDILMMENSRPEVYTEEHEKLLGETKTEWTLFVDGYGKDGKKIYDQVRGKTCHQCRQKTLGHRTHCIQCNLVQGQFCGDCLYMRYGENVLEAKQNPDWICPVCRGICNCSLCRQAKGWAPTGIMYRKISSLGYKSVAHYLIQTRRSDPTSEKNEEPVSAKRSLPFSSEEVESKDDVAKIDNIVDPEHKNSAVEVESEDGIVNIENVAELKNKNSKLDSEDGIVKAKAIKDEKPSELKSSDDVSETENKNKVNESQVRVELTNVESKVSDTDDEWKNRVGNDKSETENKESEVNETVAETKPGSRKKRGAAVAVENSIGTRLRSRRKCV